VAVVPGSGILAHLLSRSHPRPIRLAVAGAAPAELPEIERELDEIKRRFSGARLERDAGVATVRELLAGYDAVHVASHGAFQPMFPAGSGLRLADGWLTALDLLQCGRTARFVCLSACATGQQAVTPGEELLGVVRALLAGGTRTAVLAPGVLDDSLASDTSRLLYRELLTTGPGGALRMTQLALRQEHPHPALWAGLQLYGNPRPWEVEP
jgi:CHAT domain-containing protein